MGVDYEGVGGVGIHLDHELLMSIDAIVDKETEELNTELIDDFFSKHKLSYTTAGGYCYSGDYEYDYRVYLIVGGHTIQELYDNSPPFIKKVNDALGTSYTLDDVVEINDYLVW